MNKQSKQIGLHFGALADTFSKQLRAQKVNFDKEEMKFFEKQGDAIIRLKFADILSESESKKAQDKLFKKILKHIQTLNP